MDLKEICRACLRGGITMVPLFDVSSPAIIFGSTSLVDLFKAYAEITITQNDGFSQQICVKCLHEIRRSYNFKVLCQRADKVFNRLKEKSVDKDGNFNDLLLSFQQLEFSLQDEIANDVNFDQLIEELNELAYNPRLNQDTTIVKLENGIEISESPAKDAECDVSDFVKREADICVTNEVLQCQSYPATVTMIHVTKNHIKEEYENLVDTSENESNTCNDTANHASKKYLCSFVHCSMAFESSEELQNHLKHAGKHRFQCHVCSKLCDSKSRLAEHTRIHSNEKPFKCVICSRAFRRRDILDNHLISHSDERPYECTFCSRKFKRKDTLTKHTNQNHRDMISPNVLQSMPSRRVTKNIKDENREFKCKICTKVFHAKLNLAQHQRVHSETRPFICEVCSKSFAWKKSLSTHKLTHSRERPFKCLVCPSSFKQKTHLGKHTREVHSAKMTGKNSENSTDDEDERLFKCRKCPSNFKLELNLTKHIKKWHRAKQIVEYESINEEDVDK